MSFIPCHPCSLWLEPEISGIADNVALIGLSSVSIRVHPWLCFFCLPEENATCASNELLLAKSTLMEPLTVRERPGNVCFRFWHEGPGFDRNMFSAAVIEASINDIHENPVKRGLCKRAVDWKWSSACFHTDAMIDPDLSKLFRPDPAWFDRSGVQTEHS